MRRMLRRAAGGEQGGLGIVRVQDCTPQAAADVCVQ